MDDKKKRILQIGAGSMGSRRIRDLLKREDTDVFLYDMREDRRKRAEERFGIRTFSDLGQALELKPEILIISSPPDEHKKFIELALEKRLHSFCEAEIWTYDHNVAEARSRENKTVNVCSSSMNFLPIVGQLKKILDEKIGKLHTYSYCLSTYMPTWHPGEGDEYYARQRATSAGREMVPFELGFLNNVFGCPEYVAGNVILRGNLDHMKEDVWCLQMKLDNGAAGQLQVLMGAECTLRKGLFVGEKGYCVFDMISGDVMVSLHTDAVSERYNFGDIPGLLESIYLKEINSFIDLTEGKDAFAFSYRMSAIATAALAAAEKSSVSGAYEKVDISMQPSLHPDRYR